MDAVADYKTENTINPAVYYQKNPQDTTKLFINKLFVDLQNKYETFKNDECKRCA